MKKIDWKKVDEVSSRHEFGCYECTNNYDSLCERRRIKKEVERQLRGKK